MSETTILARAAFGASSVTSAALADRANAGDAPARGRTEQEDKYLQTVLKFWRTLDGEPPYSDTWAALFADDCIVRVGAQGETVVEGKQATKALFRTYDQSRYKIDITRTFVSGRVVITDFDFSSWKNKGDTPKPAPGHYLGFFVFKGDKIWMWNDVAT